MQWQVRTLKNINLEAQTILMLSNMILLWKTGAVTLIISSAEIQAPWAKQLYFTDILQCLEHAMTAAIFRDMLKGTNCVYKRNSSFCEQPVINMSCLNISVCVSTKSLPHIKWEEPITTILQASDDAGTQIQNYFWINNNLWIEQCKLFCTYNIYSTVS